jgi:hypothetical protein
LKIDNNMQEPELELEGFEEDEIDIDIDNVE